MNLFLILNDEQLIKDDSKSNKRLPSELNGLNWIKISLKVNKIKSDNYQSETI